MKISNRIELKNIATDHSADVDYQDFKKAYRECTKEPYNVLTIDTTLPASDPLRFRKNLFGSYKMTITDHIKLLDRIIMQNEVQYGLDRKAAKIFALSSNNLDKHEYLTGVWWPITANQQKKKNKNKKIEKMKKYSEKKPTKISWPMSAKFDMIIF